MKNSSGCFLVLVIVVALSGTSTAYPPFGVDHGNNCSVCHGQSPADGGLEGGGEERQGAMSVLSDIMFDPDESMGTPPGDWQDRGELKMFTARPGQTIDLTMQVENGAIEYAVQLKRLEKEGFSGAGNKLAGHLTPDPSWVAQGTGDTTYYTSSPDDFDGYDWAVDEGPIPYTFSLTLALNTPIDLYDLEFAAAGRDSATAYGKWYGDEHFYLNVVPESSPSLLFGFGLGALCFCVRRHRRRE